MSISVQSHCDTGQKKTCNATSQTEVLGISWGNLLIGKTRMSDKTGKQNADDAWN